MFLGERSLKKLQILDPHAFGTTNYLMMWHKVNEQQKHFSGLSQESEMSNIFPAGYQTGHGVWWFVAFLVIFKFPASSTRLMGACPLHSVDQKKA